MQNLLRQFCGRRVLITGHTGFKGSWMSELLLSAGAEVTGFALPAQKNGLFEMLGLERRMCSITGDIRDLSLLRRAFQEAGPEFVFHLAAQPLVRESYRDPAGTYSTNVMGTVNVLECVRTCGGVRSVVNVTTDKVYANQEQSNGYRENDPLDGFDPYANSKSCSELVTRAYIRSFLAEQGIAVSAARAGNVIGGGDFAKDRILPDCIRAARQGIPIQLRNPYSIRPYQHVLEPLSAYLLIAKAQYGDINQAGAYNVGPDAGDCLTTAELTELFCKYWGETICWTATGQAGPHEVGCLRLDCSHIAEKLGWRPRWNAETAVQKTVEWTKWLDSGGNVREITNRQIAEYMEEKHGQGNNSGMCAAVLPGASR